MTPQRGGEHVYESLRSAGIELLIGIPGTQTLPLDRTVAQRDEMRYLMARHETAIPHIAWGYHEAGGGIAATLTVPGPGDTNAMHGLKNAYEDCVPLIHLSAEVNPADRGKGEIHEIERDTVDNAVLENVYVERPREVRSTVDQAIATATTPPCGPVRVGIPRSILAGETSAPKATIDSTSPKYESTDAIDSAVSLLETADRPLVHIGGGARRATDGSAAVRTLVDTINAPYVTSYKGKGVLDETRPRWLGTTASHLNAGARRVLNAADVVVSVGSDLDGVATDNWSLPLGEQLIHINLDPAAFDRSYDADVAIASDAGTAVQRLADRGEYDGGWNGGAVASTVREEYLDHLRGAGLLEDDSPARTPAVLRAIEEEIPQETTIVTDVGGFRLWAFQLLRARGPTRYVTAGSWAGMGVGLPGAIGASLGAPSRPTLCLTGDGGLLMCLHELHTAVEEGVDLTIVVFDNADYGTISKSPEIAEYGGGRQFSWTAPDYVQIAEGFGCEATRVSTPSATGDAVQEALGTEGVSLITVSIDHEEMGVKAAASYDSTIPLNSSG